jgi:hypothetical protein
MTRIAVILAIIVSVGLTGCPSTRRPPRKQHVEAAPARVEPAPHRPRHPSHEHAHGAHPHPRDEHHHHPHPHPHLAGVNGHHHPY